MGQDISTTNREISEIKAAIDALRNKLNKAIGKGGELRLNNEIMQTSHQLDILIKDYYIRTSKIYRD